MDRRTMVRLSTAVLAGAALRVPGPVAWNAVIRKWNFGWVENGNGCRLVHAWEHPEGVEWETEEWPEVEWSIDSRGIGVYVRVDPEALAGSFDGWAKVGTVTRDYIGIDVFGPGCDVESLREELGKIPGLGGMVAL